MKVWMKKFWQEWVKPLLLTIIVLGSMRSALADWNDVPTGSMKPTILEGDRVFVNKLAYDLKVPFTRIHVAKWSNPHRGDIVVFFSPYDEKRLVKRVVGLPGDKVELRNEKLFVNGVPAVYEAPNPKVVAQFDPQQRSEYIFATEKLGDKAHSMMLVPNQYAVRSFGPITVPGGSYFVMGDNRDESFDSRFIGFIDRDRIVGRANAVVLSFDRNHNFFPRWQRFFSPLA